MESRTIQSIIGDVAITADQNCPATCPLPSIDIRMAVPDNPTLTRIDLKPFGGSED
jgi:hypothetical protein